MKINQRRAYLSLLSCFACVAFLTVFLLARLSDAQEPRAQPANKEDISKSLIGTWKLEQAKSPGSPSGIGTRLKMFNGTHWCVIQPDAAGKIVFLHGGTYEFSGTDLKTKTDFAGELTATFIGKTGTFTIEIDGDTLRQIDPNGVFDETWSRVKNTGTK